MLTLSLVTPVLMNPCLSSELKDICRVEFIYWRAYCKGRKPPCCAVYFMYFLLWKYNSALRIVRMIRHSYLNDQINFLTHGELLIARGYCS